MNAIELAHVVLQYRLAQQEYVRTGSVTACEDSLRLGKKLDRCVAMVLEGQKELFSDSPPPSGPHDAV